MNIEIKFRFPQIIFPFSFKIWIFCILNQNFKIFKQCCIAVVAKFNGKKILQTVHCTIYSVRCTVYCVQCTVYSVRCKVYGVQCTMYNCTPYIGFYLVNNFDTVYINLPVSLLQLYYKTIFIKFRRLLGSFPLPASLR